METIRKATAKTFEEMPRIFGALEFCRKVRNKLGTETMDGTILRRLRELRADGIASYVVFDTKNSQYIKREQVKSV